MTWNEEDHPRDGKGQFTEAGNEGAGASGGESGGEDPKAAEQAREQAKAEAKARKRARLDALVKLPTEQLARAMLRAALEVPQVAGTNAKGWEGIRWRLPKPSDGEPTKADPNELSLALRESVGIDAGLAMGEELARLFPLGPPRGGPPEADDAANGDRLSDALERWTVVTNERRRDAVKDYLDSWGPSDFFEAFTEKQAMAMLRDGYDGADPLDIREDLARPVVKDWIFHRTNFARDLAAHLAHKWIAGKVAADAAMVPSFDSVLNANDADYSAPDNLVFTPDEWADIYRAALERANIAARPSVWSSPESPGWKPINDAIAAKPWKLEHELPATGVAKTFPLAVRAGKALDADPRAAAAVYGFTHKWETCSELKGALLNPAEADEITVRQAEALQRLAAAEYSRAVENPDEAITLYRAANNKTFEELRAIAQADRITLETLSSFTFSSTTADSYANNDNDDERVTKAGSVVLHVRAGGLGVWQRSKYPTEGEVILPRGATFEVVARKFDQHTSRLDLLLMPLPIGDVPKEPMHLADWNEEDHPRDERGRFAPSGEGGGAGAPEPAPKGRLPVPYRREMWAPEVQPTKTKEEAARWARRLFSAHLHPGAPDEARVSALVQNDEMELALAQHRAELKGPGAGAQDARRTLWRHRDSDMGPSLLAASFGRDSLSEDEHAAAREEWGKAVAEWFEKREPTALELRNLAADVWEKNRNRIRAYLPAWGDTGEAWEAINFERRGYPPSEKERAMVGRVEAAMVEAAEQEDVRHVGRLAEQEYPKLRDDPGAPPLGSDAFVDALEKRIHDAFVETRGREPPALVAGGQAYWVTEHYGVSAVTFEKGTGWRRVGAMTPNAFDAVQGVAQHPVIAEVLERAPLTGGIEVRTLFADAGGVYDHMEGRILVSVSTLPEVARGLPTADSYVGDEPWTVGVHWSSANRSQPGGMHSVVIHELGHHVFAALRNKAGFEKTPETEAASRLFEAHNKPGTRLSVYSATNEGEFEAEAFAAYIEDPEDLAKRFPDIHAWVRTSLVKLGVTNPDARPKPRQWEFLSLSAEADAPAPQGEPVDVEAWLDLWAELRELAAERPLTEEDLLAFRDDEEALGVFDHEALATFASSLGIALHAVTLADWDEDAHPRDERGRFTSGGAGLRQPLEHQGNDLPGPPLLDPDMVRQAWWPPGADPPGRNGEPPGNNGRPWGSGPRDQPVPPLEARAERWRNRPLIERLSDPRRREVPEGWDPSSAPRLWSEFDRNAAMGERVAHEGQSARRAMDMLEERRRQERIRATMDQAAANIAAEPDRASAVLAEYGRLNAAIRTPAIREEVARIFEQRFPLAGKDFDTPTWRNRFRKWMGSSTFGYRATDEDVVRGAMGPGSSVMNQVTGQRYPFTIDADLRRVIQEAREAEAVRAKRAAVLAQGITATNDEGEAASAIAQGWGTIHYHAVVDSASKYGEFAVKLYDEGGQQVSRRYERTVERDSDGIHVTHDFFELEGFARDKGIGEEVLRRSFQVYEAENVADVSVTAGLSTGPYTWADFGFDWDDETNEEMRKSFARWLRFHSNMSSEQIGEATAEIRHSWHLADFGLSGQHGAPISVSDKLDGTHLGKAFLLSVRPMWEGRVDMTPSSESYKRMRWRLFGEGRRYDDQGIKRATPKRASPTTLSASEPWWADPYWASFLPPGMKQADPGEDDLDALLDLEDLGL